MQLVGDAVSMLDTMKNVRIGPPEVFEKFGVAPDKVVDVQALCGDSVDNVPGAPGIGIKTASALITEYGDLDTLLARAGEIKQEKRRADPDRLRRPDPPLARSWSRLDCDTPLPAPIDALTVGRAGSRRAGRLPGGHGVSHPGPADGRSRRPPRPAPVARAAARRRPIDDRRLRLRAGPGHAGRLDRQGARGGRGRLRHRDRLPSPRPTPVSAAFRWRWRRARPATFRSGHCEAEGLALEQAADLDQIPLAGCDRSAEADAGGSGGPQGRAERQVRPGGAVALWDRRGADRRHHADLLCAGGGPAQPRHGRAFGAVARPPADQLQGRWPATGKAQKSFKHVELDGGHRPTPPRTPTSPCGSIECSGPRLAREGLLTVYETLERPLPHGAGGHGVRRHPGRPGSAAPALARFLHAHGRVWRPRPSRWPAGPSTWAVPSRSATCCSARWRWRAARRPPPGSGAPTPACWKTWPPRATPCRACCSTGASSPS